MPAYRDSSIITVALRQAGERGEYTDVSAHILGLEFTDKLGKVDSVKIQVNNFDLSEFDNPLWAHGNIMRFSFGRPGSVAPVRYSVIKEVTGGRILEIRARARSVFMDTANVRRTYHNVTHSDLVHQIGERNGYGPDFRIVEPTEHVYDVITQPNLSDAQMLRKLAHFHGYKFYVAHDGLHWHEEDHWAAPRREFVYYTDPDQGDIIDFEVQNDLTRRPAKVVVKGRDPLNKKNIEESAENSTDTERAVLREETSLPNYKTFLGTESGQVVHTYEQTRHSNVENREEAKQEAKAGYRRSSRTAVKMVLTVVGDATIAPDTVVDVSGMGARLSGKYFVRAVNHKLSGSSPFITEIGLTTDGQHSSHKRKRRKDKSEAAFLKALNLLKTAGLQIALTSELDPKRAALAIKRVNQIVSEGEQLAKGGFRDQDKVSRIANASVALSRSAAQAARGTDLEARVFGEITRTVVVVASIAQSLAGSGYDKAAGVANKKELEAKDAAGERTRIDPETGEVIVGYADTQPRGKK